MSTSKIPSLGELLKNNSSYISLTPTNKILCSISGHEMPPRGDVVYSYINSAKFQKLIKWYSFNFDIFLPYIVQDKKNKLKMHCKLTNQSLNKIPDEIKAHMNGKKFIRLKKEQDIINQENEDEKLDIWIPPEEEFDDDEDDDEENKPKNKKSKKIVDDLSDLIDSDVELVIGDDDDEDDDDDDDDDNNNEKEVKKVIIEVKAKSKKDNKSSKKEESKPVKSSSNLDKKTSKKGIENMKKSNKKK